MQKILLRWVGVTAYPSAAVMDIASLHGLYEMINQATHFYPGKMPSCIDLILCLQFIR